MTSTRPPIETSRSAGYMDQPIPVSAVILTYNEEKNIETCLKSIARWCQEIFVVDSGSRDKTLDIVAQYTSQVYVHSYIDHASQLDWSLKNLPFTYEWIIPLDADHMVTEKLKLEIIKIVQNPEPGVNGYYSKHRYFFWGRPIRGFKPYSLRLFRRDKTRVDHSELVDFRFVVEGKTKKLAGAIHESNQNELSIDFWIDKHQKFSSRIAIEEILRINGNLKWSLKPRLFGTPDERIIFLKEKWYRMPLYVRPVFYFLYRYVFRLGCLDGMKGLIYHFLHAFWFTLIIDIKIARIRERLAQGELSLEQLKEHFIHKF